MRSRGELLFAKAVILFEGETEEQALPMFAHEHWKQYPFERGMAFVGVGGDGNYLPFLRILKTMGIPWFIFSDGETEAIKSINTALAGIEQTATKNPAVIILPNGNSIEEYLLNNNYQDAIKEAIISFHRPFHNPAHEGAKTDEIRNWDDEKLLKFMIAHKTGLSPHWANAIIHLGGYNSIPRPIRYLLKRIDKALA